MSVFGSGSTSDAAKVAKLAKLEESHRLEIGLHEPGSDKHTIHTAASASFEFAKENLQGKR